MARTRPSFRPPAPVGGPDPGQVFPLVLAFVLLTTVVSLLVLGRLGPVLADRAQARTAADAGALAGVVGGEDAARRVVEENDGILVELVADGTTVEVRARVGRAEATSVAAARR